ncbi:hypothetical protein A2886_00970 [candidate division WWE3 bacterium RIFCSPHIGHO2_01_FULL_42_13]|uniref:Glycosyltransferase RgtA/B/C/D-like domain-containing protein n=1 Tax=candidate division WWE3 bacterium RIFCSPHIGHO2_01_FULL_42_13 TaxID=1802617 RepID=A0A1F4UQN3_UNCKA|nr:MAG: hypothetical protein A2886_00970 [candidate division WWE3 bacterium RIFCSPHIGHO2_01_FULL_42_13]
MFLNKIRKIKYEIYVFVLFVLTRLPSLGYDMFTTDEWKWKQRIYDFGTGVFTLDFAKTIQMYHPGVTLMWLGAIAVKFHNLAYRVFTGTNPQDNDINALFQLHFTQKLFIVLALGILISFIFYILRKVLNIKYASIAVALFALEPLYVALTRVVHLEGLQATFMLASFLTLYMYVSTEERKKWLFISSALGALAMLTKTSALFIVPFAALLLFGYRLWETGSFAKALKWAFSRYLLWLATFIVAFVAFWPAMWTNAPQALTVLQKGIVDVGIEGDHIQLFFGKWVEDPGPVFYWAVLVLRSSLYLIIGLLGSLVVFPKLDKRQKKFATFTLLYALFYIIELSIPSKKLDRYILPSLIALSLVASLFFERMLHLLVGRFSKVSNAFALFGIVLLIPAFTTLAVLHPDYFSYYSPLTGGLKNGIWMLEPKWVIGHFELIKYLEAKKYELSLQDFGPGEDIYDTADVLQNRLVVAFPEKYYTQLHPFVRRMGAWATISSIDFDSRKAQFFIYPVWFDESEPEDPFRFIGQVKLRGVPIYNVYENTARDISK